MSGRTFTISDEALEQAVEAGLKGSREELAGMARLAAPLTHEVGNRRFDGWWLRIEDGQVTAVGLLEAKQMPKPTKDERTAAEKKEARIRVEQAIALHFPRKPKTT